MFYRQITVFGAVTIIASIVAFAGQQASAAPEYMTNTIAASEEQIGPNIYQVSRAVVNAPPTRVQDALTDYAHTENIFDNVVKCKVISATGNKKQIAFTVKSMGNLWKFDYILEIKESPGLIEWHRISGAFKSNEGFWKLEPLDEGRSTRVTYAKFIDGGILLPKFVVNKQVRESMPVVITNLKNSVESTPMVATDHS